MDLEHLHKFFAEQDDLFTIYQVSSNIYDIGHKHDVRYRLKYYLDKETALVDFHQRVKINQNPEIYDINVITDRPEDYKEWKRLNGEVAGVLR